MKVSIIIPVYNAESTIKRCLDSIINQTNSQWEIIAINDGSADESLNILKTYSRQYENKIRVIDQQNAGVTKTRERGVRESTAEYIMFIDNDDYIDSNYVETFLNAIDHTDCDCVLGGYRRINEKKHVIFQYAPETEWLKYSIMTPWARIFKREFIIKEDIRFFNYPMGEDIYFNMQVYKKANKIKRISYIGYNWFYNTESVSNTLHKGLKDGYDPIILLDKIDETIENARDEIYQYWFVKWVVWYLLFSGREAEKNNFLSETTRLFEWLQKRKVNIYFPLFGNIVKGEPLKNKIFIRCFLILRKLKLLSLFATIYCKGSRT